jgi:F0F1-type ATP synthase assembly protein I
VFAIPVATGLGYWLDGRFDTSPYLLILGAALGFAAFVTRLLRLGKQLQAIGDGDD